MTALETLALPDEPSKWGAWLDERGRSSLRTAADQVAALKIARPGDTAILQLWNDAGISISNATAVTSLHSSVHPDAAVIEQAEAIEVELGRFVSDLHTDHEVFTQLSSIRAEALDDGARRVLAHALRTFRRSGVVTKGPARGSASSTSARPSSARRSRATSVTAGGQRRSRPPHSPGFPRTSWPGTRPAKTVRSPSPPSTRTCCRS
jgi:thimet oligopeptidase